jgi:hypothetical protein
MKKAVLKQLPLFPEGGRFAKMIVRTQLHIPDQF